MPFIYDRLGLEGKVAVVTGSGQGIGKAIALGLAEVGANIAVAEMDEETGPATAAEIKAMGREALFVRTDARDPEQVEKLFGQVQGEWGRVDVMANNAGGGFPAPALELSPNGFDSILRVNMKTTFLCSKAAAANMIERGEGGSIVSIASMNGLISSYHQAAYGAAKAGIMGLTKALAGEWAANGIRVNAVAPGMTDTEGTRPRRGNDDYAYVPLGRVGQPSEIASAVVFLASEMASYVTGETLVVDGGTVIRPRTIGLGLSG